MERQTNDDRLTQLNLNIKKFRLWLGEWRGVLIAGPTVALLVIAIRSLGFLQLLEWAAFDRFFGWRRAEATDRRIVLVEISEADIEKIGQWPMSDKLLAELIGKIKAQKPRVIGLDLYRNLPVEPGHKQLIAIFESTSNLIGITKVGGQNYSRRAVASSPTLKRLNQIGASDILIDDDGKVRRALLAVRTAEGQTLYSLSVRLALMYLEKEGITLQKIDRTDKYRLEKATFSRLTENDGGYVNADTGGYQILFNFRSHPCRRRNHTSNCKLFKTVSTIDVLENRVPQTLLRDRIVLIGSTAESLKDRFFIPYTRSYLNTTTGVEIHADLTSQIISTALNQRPLLQVWPESLENLWIGIWSIVGAILGFWLLRIRWKAASILLAGGFLISSAYIAFLFNWWIPVVPPLLALIGSGVAITGYIAYIERQDRKTVMNLLEQHVSPKIAQAVWRNRHQLLKEGQVLGQKMTATVLFTDIKGFTSITEKTAPEKLMFWLNDYMNVMAQIVLDRNGVVDKFIGDAVMAIFGVPIPSTTEEAIAKDATAAISCALEMADKLSHLNQQWHQQGLPTIEMRVGIATGTVIAGSLGSRERLNYTAIGDSVNVAARLESFDKSIDGGICRILISEETYQHIREKFSAQFVGCVNLKGREQAVNIYQIMPMANS